MEKQKKRVRFSVWFSEVDGKEIIAICDRLGIEFHEFIAAGAIRYAKKIRKRQKKLEMLGK